jgi:hypothetical protein
MLRPILAITLSLLIAACPLICRVIALCAHDGEASAEASVTTACHHCSHEDRYAGEEQDNPAPVPTCPCEQNGRDCICSGAIVQEGMDFEPVLLPSLDVLVDIFFSANLTAATHTSLEFAPTDGSLSEVSGRDLRTRISSFLC